MQGFRYKSWLFCIYRCCISSTHARAHNTHAHTQHHAHTLNHISHTHTHTHKHTHTHTHAHTPTHKVSARARTHSGGSERSIDIFVDLFPQNSCHLRESTNCSQPKRLHLDLNRGGTTMSRLSTENEMTIDER